MAVTFQSLIAFVFSVMWALFTEFKIILVVSLSFCGLVFSVFALSLKEVEETSEVHNTVRQKSVLSRLYTQNQLPSICTSTIISLLRVLQYS